MKVFLAASIIFAAQSFYEMASASEIQRVQSSGPKYEVYQVFESEIKNATILIDYKEVATDCHGLDFKYEVTQVKSGTFLVTKQPMMHTLQVCPPEDSKVLQDGAKIELPVHGERGGHSSLIAEIIAPAEAQVELHIER